MAEMPTWNGQTVTQDNLAKVVREAAAFAVAKMGKIERDLPKEDLLRLVEAGAFLGAVATWIEQVAMPTARDKGASWAELAAAQGFSSRSTAQSRYEKVLRHRDRDCV